MEPIQQPRTEERLCVLLDVAPPNVLVQLAHRDAQGGICLTDEEFRVPMSALDNLRLVPGLLFSL